MIYFRSDYSQGAHPKVLEALSQTNMEHHDGYAMDAHCENAANLIKKLIDRDDAAVHMMVGGTPCNITTISAALRPYEGVIAPRTGHIYVHETGGVEATGHRVITVEGINGKLNPDLIDQAMKEFDDEHTVLPKMVYISQPTEIGSIYSKEEVMVIKEKCNEHNLYLYMDGARLGTALTSKYNNLSIKDIASLCDAFYIGGTKNGALLGEALVILNPVINDHYRWMIKRQNGMLAKGRIIGVQFEALFEGGEDCLYYEIAKHSNRMAERLKAGLESLGIDFYSESQTNQLFPIFQKNVVEDLEKEFFFYRWAPEEKGMIPVRFVTGWGTKEEDVDALIEKLKG